MLFGVYLPSTGRQAAPLPLVFHMVAIGIMQVIIQVWFQCAVVLALTVACPCNSYNACFSVYSRACVLCPSPLHLLLSSVLKPYWLFLYHPQFSMFFFSWAFQHATSPRSTILGSLPFFQHTSTEIKKRRLFLAWICGTSSNHYFLSHDIHHLRTVLTDQMGIEGRTDMHTENLASGGSCALMEMHQQPIKSACFVFCWMRRYIYYI